MILRKADIIPLYFKEFVQIYHHIDIELESDGEGGYRIIFESEEDELAVALRSTPIELYALYKGWLYFNLT